MRIFKENTVNDLEIGASNQLAIISGIEAVAQACTSAMEAQLGEMQYDVLSGIPTEATLWSGVPNLPQFEFFARRALSQIEGVIAITNFTVALVGDGATYAAAINTVFGPTGIEGVIGGL